jgi:superfamily II DNA or RNA helicase
VSNLRDFQQTLVSEVKQAWAEDARNVMMISPTGSGKTVMVSEIIKQMGVPTVAIAHRQELVSQIALALNRDCVQHGIIAPDAIIKQIVTMEHETHGRSLFSPRSMVRVAGVNSLGSLDALDPWISSVELVVQDEGHHVLRGNIWGRAMDLFTNPAKRGLFPTAHAIRGDGKGLGRHADGLVDRLVIGPSCRDLINRGFLCDYKLIGIPDDTDLSEVNVTDTGEFSQEKLRAAVHANKHIVGDVVEHYLHWAPGKLGVTFAVDIEAATQIVRAFQAKGVNAEMITADTPLHIRGQLMRRFRAREILQLVSVDVLGEGVDVPAIEVVSMARHTMSFQLYAQQFGRGLRTLVGGFISDFWHTLTDAERLEEIARSPKPKAIIIDHVNNWERHGLPDVPRTYTLDKRTKRKKKAVPDDIPLRHCVNPQCLQPYLAVLVACPNCGAKPVPARRSAPEYVDGNLFELDAEALRAMQMEIARVDGGVPIVPGVSAAAQAHIGHTHHDRQQSQAALRHAMAVWMGYQAHLKRDTSESQKRFYYAFKVDVGTAQTLGKGDADELHTRIRQDLGRNNVVESAS